MVIVHFLESPVFLISCNYQIGLGLKKIVKTALVDLCPFANLIHAHRAVAVLMNEIKSHGQKLFFGITGSAHNLLQFRNREHTVIYLYNQSTIF